MLPPVIQTAQTAQTAAAGAETAASAAPDSPLPPPRAGTTEPALEAPVAGRFSLSLAATGIAAGGTVLPAVGKELPLPPDTALAALPAGSAADTEAGLPAPPALGEAGPGAADAVAANDSRGATGLVALELMLPPAPRDVAAAAGPAELTQSAALPGPLAAAALSGPVAAAAPRAVPAARGLPGMPAAAVADPPVAVPGIAGRASVPQAPVVADAAPATELPVGAVQIRDAAGRNEFALADTMRAAVRGKPGASTRQAGIEQLRVDGAVRLATATEPLPLTSLGMPAGGAAPTAAPAAPTLPAIPLAVNDAGWGDALAERVLVMAGQKIQSADIRLNPAELGPLRVEIRLEDGAAQVNFQAQHAVTREAIEQALPRLRELFAGEGLTLTGSSVGGEALRDDRGNAAGRTADTSAGGAVEAGDEPSDEAAVSSGRLQLGLIDTFA